MTSKLATTLLVMGVAGSVGQGQEARPQVPPQTLPPALLNIPRTGEAFATTVGKGQKLDPRLVRAIRTQGSWQVYAGGTLFRDCGESAENAREVARVLRELYATEWITLGGDRPIIEYGLCEGKTIPVAASPRQSVAMDLKTLRVEEVRGVWCLRDDTQIVLNFGLEERHARAAMQAIEKYGFNRIGMIGRPLPVLSYFYVEPNAPERIGGPGITIPAQFQEEALTHTGIEVPGMGFHGEKIRFDPNKLEVRKERAEWVITTGTEVLARFGGSEWTARDAARVLKDSRLNEFCKFGTADVTFFLSDGKAPTKVPFFAQGQRFEPRNLTVRELAGRWWVCDGVRRQLLPAGSRAEADLLVKILQAYGFNQLCQVGTSPRTGLRFLAKAR